MSRLEDAHIEAAPVEALYSAVLDANLKEVERLACLTGINLDERTFDGELCLMAAIRTGNTRISSFLIEKGAGINARDNDWLTPVHEAACCGEQELLQFMVLHGGNIDSEDLSGCTPLHLAAANGKENTVEMLLQLGADIEAEEYNGFTALMNAAFFGHEEVVRVLLSHGAYVDDSEANGTPIYCALQNGHYQIAHLLLRRHKTILEDAPRIWWRRHPCMWVDTEWKRLEQIGFDSVFTFWLNAIDSVQQHKNSDLSVSCSSHANWRPCVKNRQ